jgi:hypothetical protein
MGKGSCWGKLLIVKQAGHVQPCAVLPCVRKESGAGNMSVNQEPHREHAFLRLIWHGTDASVL